MVPNKRMHSDKLKTKQKQQQQNILFQSKEKTVTMSQFVTKNSIILKILFTVWSDWIELF